MARYIAVEGHRCKVVDALGYNPDIGQRVTVVEHEGSERKAVGGGRYGWRFWTARDRAQPLVDELRRRMVAPD